MLTIDEFISLFNGTLVDFDNYYGDQCADLVQFYSRAIGGPRFTGNAKDFFNQAGSFYTQIPNTPTGVPVKGDIIVLSGLYNGGPGHVGISNGVGDVNTMQLFEQNDPTGSNCHIKTYNYNYCLGWLHPNQLPQSVDCTAAVDAYRQTVKDKLNTLISSLG